MKNIIEIPLNRFRANIHKFVDKAILEHQPIRVKCSSGKDFIVISAEDWEREHETLYVLSNRSLIAQLEESLKSFDNKTGYKPTQEQLDAMDRG